MAAGAVPSKRASNSSRSSMVIVDPPQTTMTTVGAAEEGALPCDGSGRRDDGRHVAMISGR